MSRRRTDLSDPPGSEKARESGFEYRGDAPTNALEAASARAVRVAELRDVVAAGTYRPDARKVAAALLKSRARRALFGDDH